MCGTLAVVTIQTNVVATLQYSTYTSVLCTTARCTFGNLGYCVGNPHLVPWPSHILPCTQENSGRPDQFADVMITYLPPFHNHSMVADIHFVCNQKSTRPSWFFLHALKNMWRPGYETREFLNTTSRGTGVPTVQAWKENNNGSKG